MIRRDRRAARGLWLSALLVLLGSASDKSAAEALPLSFQAERSGLPVPVVAGRGGQVALSYVEEATGTLQHTRPRGDQGVTNGSVQTRPRVSVTLAGATTALRAVDATGDEYEGVLNGQTAALVREGSGWVLTDGSGVRYVFSHQVPAPGQRVYLARIEDPVAPADNWVHLAYTAKEWDDGWEVQLQRVRYNFANGCARDEVQLAYESPLPGTSVALGYGFVPGADEPQVLRELLSEVKVVSRGDQDPAQGGCASSGAAQVAAYRLEYAADPESGAPVLAKLWGAGQAGTDELPLATYTYGELTTADAQGERALTWGPETTIAAPAGVEGRLGWTEIETDGSVLIWDSAEATTKPWTVERSTQRSMTVDVTGDGLPDRVYPVDDVMQVAQAVASESGVTYAAPVPLFAHSNASGWQATTPLGYHETAGAQLALKLKINGLEADYTQAPPGATGAVTAVLVQLLDMNGDGRPDLVDARQPEQWIIYYNRPAAEHVANPTSPVYWVATTVNVAELHASVTADWFADSRQLGDVWQGLGAPGAGWGLWPDRLPLNVTVTGPALTTRMCWVYDADVDVDGNGTADGGWVSYAEKGYGELCESAPSEAVKTYELLALRDLNGDGGVDLAAVRYPVQLNWADKFDQAVGLGVANGPVNQDLPPADLYWKAECVSDVLVLPEASILTQCVGPYSDDPGTPWPESVQEVKLTWGVGRSRTSHEVDAAHDWSGQAPLPAQALEVYYNTRGGRGDWVHAGQLFSATPYVLDEDLSCDGLRVWGGLFYAYEDYTKSGQECGLIEVNGDGLADWLDGGQVRLGTGSSWSSVTVDVPDEVFTTVGKAPSCFVAGIDPLWPMVMGGYEEPEPPFLSVSSDLVTDFNGDGLPDVVQATGVRLGYGGELTGAAGGAELSTSMTVAEYAPILATDPSSGAKVCVGSRQTEGLLDLDGDGVLEWVRAGEGADQSLKVRYLQGAAGHPALSKGRVVEQCNGYGGCTQYTYGNAKLDARSAHAVPSAEVVLTQTQTVRRDPGGTVVETLEPTRFAYGDIGLQFNPLVDRWVPTGYGRQVLLRGAIESDRISGVAVVSETYRPADFAGASESAVYSRLWLTGRPKATTTLEGEFGLDPRELLDTAVASHPQARSRQEQTYTLSWQTPSGAVPAYGDWADCGYDGADYVTAPGTNLNPRLCLTRFRIDGQEQTQWTGDEAPALGEGQVATQSVVETRDALFRPTRVRVYGDTARSDDDVCVETTYVDNAAASLYSAVQRRRVVACEDGQPETLLSETVQVYDGQAYDPQLDQVSGELTQGLLRETWLTRVDLGTGAVLERYATTQYTYDERGQVASAVSENADGRTQTTALTYDPFGLVAERITVSHSDAPGTTYVSERVHDPLTLQVQASIDPHGLTLITDHDGYGRPVRHSVLPAGSNDEYVLSTLSYGGDDGQALERTLSTRTFHTLETVGGYDPAATEPVPTETWTQTYVDGLGRVTRSERRLGADYGGQVLRSGVRRYNSLGQLVYASRPYVDGEATGTLYGTTYFYQPNGRVQCAVTGTEQVLAPATGELYVGGWQNPTLVLSDPSQEQYAACSDVRYENHQAVAWALGPTELTPGHVAYGVFDENRYTALGWRLEQTRRKDLPLERSTFGYNRLGQQTTITRVRNPETGVGTVTWSLAYDNLGQLLRLDEPGTATRHYSYDWWGQPVRKHWRDGATERALVSGYDALGRLTEHYETQAPVDGSGQVGAAVPVPGSLTRWFYDAVPSGESHPYGDYLLGRLALVRHYQANHVTPYRTVYPGYDALGRAFASVEEDEAGQRYRQETDYRGVGGIDGVRIQAPGGPEERTSYRYDSAQRVIGVDWEDVNGLQTLFSVSPGGLDAYGRYLDVQYGNGVSEQYSYRADARRELQAHHLLMANQQRVTQYDAPDGAGRRTGMTQLFDGVSGQGQVTSYQYDAMHRLAQRTVTDLAGAPLSEEQFAYDGLGNLMAKVGEQALIPMQADLDRLCRSEDPGQYTPGQLVNSSGTCTYSYDVLGNVVGIADPRHGTRSFTYERGSRIQGITGGGTTVEYRYGIGDAVAERVITGGAEARTQRYIGPFELRADASGTAVDRFIAGPLGLLATRRDGPGGAQLLYAHGDNAGGLGHSDLDGNEAQFRQFSAFGELANAEGAAPGTANYVTTQWGGGETLAELGLIHLGARLYHPQSGRFLQRDPLLIARDAGRMHPYGYAWNDPVTYADPSGLDPVTAGGSPSGPCDELSPYCHREEPSGPYDRFRNGGIVLGEVQIEAELSLEDQLLALGRSPVSSSTNDNAAIINSILLGGATGVSGPRDASEEDDRLPYCEMGRNCGRGKWDPEWRPVPSNVIAVGLQMHSTPWRRFAAQLDRNSVVQIVANSAHPVITLGGESELNGADRLSDTEVMLGVVDAVGGRGAFAPVGDLAKDGITFGIYSIVPPAPPGGGGPPPGGGGSDGTTRSPTQLSRLYWDYEDGIVFGEWSVNVDGEKIGYVNGVYNAKEQRFYVANYKIDKSHRGQGRSADALVLAIQDIESSTGGVVKVLKADMGGLNYHVITDDIYKTPFVRTLRRIGYGDVIHVKGRTSPTKDIKVWGRGKLRRFRF